jgi:hypothetical protein
LLNAVAESVYPGLAFKPNVTVRSAAAAVAADVLVNVLPPQALAAAVPVVPTPNPLVRFVTTVRFGPIVVATKGETPNPVCPLTSQPNKVIIGPPKLGFIVIVSLPALFARFPSPPPATTETFVTFPGPPEATFTVTVIGG